MIRYALKCGVGHEFESWFADGATFDRLSQAGHLSCAVCGDARVSKAIMAPRIATRDTDNPPVAPLSAPASPAEQALRALRRKVEAEADFVGTAFATEARAIHTGEADERPIWGQASADEVRDLVEDEIPVMPLPFGPTKAN